MASEHSHQRPSASGASSENSLSPARPKSTRQTARPDETPARKCSQQKSKPVNGAVCQCFVRNMRTLPYITGDPLAHGHAPPSPPKRECVATVTTLNLRCNDASTRARPTCMRATAHRPRATASRPHTPLTPPHTPHSGPHFARGPQKCHRSMVGMRTRPRVRTNHACPAAWHRSCRLAF